MLIVKSEYREIDDRKMGVPLHIAYISSRYCLVLPVLAEEVRVCTSFSY